MGLNVNIPKNSKLAIIGAVFEGHFNNPTPAKYDFTNYVVSGNRYNVGRSFGLDMRPNYLYYFHQMNFSMSIDAGDFLEAIDAGTVPTLQVKDSSNRKNLFHSPFRLFRYFENAAVDSFHYNLNDNSQIIGDFQCVLIQTAALVGIDPIYAQVAFSVYEITDQKFIDEYKRKH